MAKKLQHLIDRDLDLFARAERVLGSSKSVEKWFYSYPKVFAGKTPLEVYEEGRVEEIYQILGRIEHGVYS
ncbi:Uncharacterised protein [uncultured archaeon]|nr:Uncharacterised protein [uncultured archaeon]